MLNPRAEPPQGKDVSMVGLSPQQSCIYVILFPIEKLKGFGNLLELFEKIPPRKLYVCPNKYKNKRIKLTVRRQS